MTDGQIQDQGQGQEQGQAASQAASNAAAQAGNQSPSQGAAQQTHEDGDFVRIPTRNFRPITGDNDFNKVVALAKAYKDLERGGYVALADQARDFRDADGNGIDGYTLASVLTTPPQERTPEQREQLQEARQQVQQQAAAEGVHVTKAEIDKIIKEGVSKEMFAFRQENDSRAARKAAEDAEIRAYDEALDAIGHKANRKKMQYLGREVEMDPVRDGMFRPALERAAYDLYANSLNPNDPRYEQKLRWPIPPQFVRQAAEELKPHFAAVLQQKQEDAADRQNHLPNATLASGPGGRPTKHPDDMDADEEKAEVLRRVRGRLQGSNR